jgi:hypothetical protein
MLIGLAESSSHLFSSGERWSLVGAMLFALSGLVLLTNKRPPEDNGPALGRWKGFRSIAAASPLMIVAGGVMMVVAVVRGG